jgi:two-component system LytT family response regulator
MESSPPVTAVIIDDDPFCRTALQDLVAKYAKEVQIKAVCNNAKEGITAIERWDPDIIFLDILMPPGMTGFDMLGQLPSLKSQVIFTTQHEEYAIKALRFAALDYLLKPIEAIALKQALARALNKIKTNNKKAEQKPGPGVNEFVDWERLPIPNGDGYTMMKISDVVYCEADGSITKLFLIDKRMEAASRNLGDFEKLLQLYGFYRIHRSHLINVKHLKKYIRGEGGQVVMSDNTTLDVSKRAKAGLLKLMGL